MNRKLTQVADMLNKGLLVYVATVGADGTPNVSIKGSGLLADGEHIYFADFFSKKTGHNLKKNPYVAVGIYDRFTNLAVQVKGRAILHENGPIFDRITKELSSKQPSFRPPKYIAEITIESVWDMSNGPSAGDEIE